MVDLKAIDLFCGAGGFSKGLEMSGIDVKLGVDKDEVALETYSNNHNGDSLKYNIEEGIPDEIDISDYNMVFGSPPCKGFSYARGTRYLDDDRNGLVFEYIYWVSKIKPKISIMENVKGIKSISEDFISAIRKEFNDIGYNMEVYELNSANFGVPQNRNRVIFICTRDNGLDIDFKDKEETTVKDAISDLSSISDNGKVTANYNDINNYYSRNVKDLDQGEIIHNHRAKEIDKKGIENKIVKRLGEGEMYRSNRFGERYRQVWDILYDEFNEIEKSCLKFISEKRSKKDYRIQGKTVGHVSKNKIESELNYPKEKIKKTLDSLLEDEWIRKDKNENKIGYDINTKSGVRPRYVRVRYKSQSNTILTTDFKPRDKLHPLKNRGLSLREGARIQSFPDSFIFKGSFNKIASQIGNAVPPLLAKEIGEKIKSNY